jgi:hypothetical protein
MIELFNWFSSKFEATVIVGNLEEKLHDFLGMPRSVGHLVFRPRLHDFLAWYFSRNLPGSFDAEPVRVVIFPFFALVSFFRLASIVPQKSLSRHCSLAIISRISHFSGSSIIARPDFFPSSENLLLTPIPGAILVLNLTLVYPPLLMGEYVFGISDEANYVRPLEEWWEFSLARIDSVYVGEFCVLSVGKTRYHFLRHFTNPDFQFFMGSYRLIVTVCWEANRNFFHVIRNMISPLLLIPDDILHDPSARFVFPRLLPFCEEALKLLGFSDKIIFLGDRDFIFAEHLYHWQWHVPACDCQAGIPKMRDMLRKVLKLDSAPTNISAWINRESHLPRHLWNGDEIFETLRDNWPRMNWTEFTHFHSFADTVLSFNQFSFLLAPHGAALTNVMFMQNGTGYCEIQSDTSRNGFMRLARTLNIWVLLVRIPRMLYFGGNVFSQGGRGLGVNGLQRELQEQTEHNSSENAGALRNGALSVNDRYTVRS